MFKLKLTCSDIDSSEGDVAAKGIQQEFREHRQSHQDVSCCFQDGMIVLTARNDFDSNGMALLDEFGDCLSAYLADHGAVRVLSVEPV